MIAAKEVEADQVEVICLDAVKFEPVHSSNGLAPIGDQFKPFFILDYPAHTEKLPGPAI